jgi:hypothetical protein
MYITAGAEAPKLEHTPQPFNYLDLYHLRYNIL